MNVLKRIILMGFSLATAIFNLEPCIGSAVNLSKSDDNSDAYVLSERMDDEIWESPEDYTMRTGNVIKELDLNDFGIEQTRTLPSSFDISTDSTTSLYFPPVGNQAPIGSCVGWATTYYQFTYEVNQLRGITTGTNPNNIYSPSFTYNYINHGVDSGSSITNAYDILHNHGAMKLSDYPHNNSNYSLEWATNENKLIEALDYRSTAAQIVVNSTSSPNLEAVKSMIANGHIAVISTNPNGRRWGRTSANEWCVVRGSEDTEGGHAMAVVGYDDNLTITADGETLTGAFKLVNSYGTDWINNGYTWVAYDALNLTSVHEANWNYPESRSTVFRGNNTFYFISVEKCDVTFAGIVTLKTNDMWNLKFYGNQGNSATTKKLGGYGYSNNHTMYNNCKIAFDFFDVGNVVNINNCLTSFWTFKTQGNASYTNNNIKYRIVDNLNNQIAPNYGINGSLTSSNIFQCPIYVTLAKGRVTSYDNMDITSDDSLAVLQYLVNLRTFSNLQKLLADYNNDGSVDIVDVLEMNQHISSQNGNTYHPTDYIDAWGCSLADIIENEYHVTVDEFIEQLEEKNVVD